jgi:hypothetical protein
VPILSLCFRFCATVIAPNTAFAYTHSLRLSNKEREKKTGELYAYITSERFNQHLDLIEGQTDKLLKIDVDEERAHVSYGRGVEARLRPCKRRKAICARMSAASSARRIDAVNTAESTGNRGRIVGLQERRLGRTILRTYRAKVDLDDVARPDRSRQR